MGEILSSGTALGRDHRAEAAAGACSTRRSGEFADRPCLSFRGKHYSYREVGRLVDHAAKGFQALGVRRGIKVGLMLPNCPYAVICFYAVLKAGGTVVNINPLYSRFEIERQVADSDCRMLASLDVKGLYDKVAGLAGSGRPLEKLIVCRTKGMLRFAEKVVFGLFKGREVAADRRGRTPHHVRAPDRQ